MPSTRRELLKQAGQAVAACALGGTTPRLLAGTGSATTLPALSDWPTTSQIAPSLKSVVVDIREKEVLIDATVNEKLLADVIDEGIRLVTRSSSAQESWNKLIKPDDVIGIKFNSVGQEVFGSTPVFATQLIESLKRADFSPDRIMLIEAPPQLTGTLKTKTCPFGFSGSKVSFGSGEDELAAFLQEVTAIVNVPFLKSHNIAQMSCCLKNLSHAVIRRPRLCHANGCNPFVGDILSLPQVRSKLRLHVVNALRVAYEGGPIPVRDQLVGHAGILVGTDPVATDAVAIDILNGHRRDKKLRPVGDRNGQIGYIHAAAEHGLGTDDQDYMTVVNPSLF